MTVYQELELHIDFQQELQGNLLDTDSLSTEEKAWQTFGDIFSVHPPEENLAVLSQKEIPESEISEYLMRFTGYPHGIESLKEHIETVTAILCPDTLSDNGQPPKPLRDKLIILLKEVA